MMQRMGNGQQTAGARLTIKGANITARKPQPVQTSRPGESYLQFEITHNRDYTNAQGVLIKKQPLVLYCTTFNTAVMETVSKAKDDSSEKYDIEGYLEVCWRGYATNGTVEGVRFIIPEEGQPPHTEGGLSIPGSATPYVFDKKAKGVHVYPSVTFTVNQITRETEIKGLDNSQDDDQDGINALNGVLTNNGSSSDPDAMPPM